MRYDRSRQVRRGKRACYLFYECSITYFTTPIVGPREEVTTRMTKAFGLAAIALAVSMGLVASVALGVGLPLQANQHAVDATQETPSGADVTGHPDAEVNGVPPGPVSWLNESAPYGPAEWANTSGGTPTWLTTP